MLAVEAVQVGGWLGPTQGAHRLEDRWVPLSATVGLYSGNLITNAVSSFAELKREMLGQAYRSTTMD